MPSDLFFNDWKSLARVLIATPFAYVALVFLLRATGKRTLSKLNAFDLVITVALGSTLASVITSKSIALAEGVLALALLVALQFVVTALSVRVRWIDNLVKSEPTLLCRSGKPLEGAMRRQRVTHAELLTAVRESGAERLDEAEAVFLETDGTLTAILRR